MLRNSHLMIPPSSTRRKSRRTLLLESLYARRAELPPHSPERLFLEDALAEAADMPFDTND